MAGISSVQIGKQGITHNFVETLRSHFVNNKIVKICVLKSATRDREKIKEISDKLLENLGKNYTSRIIGFKIVVRKWRRDMIL